MDKVSAFEPETGAALSTARKPYKRYGADGAEAISRLQAKSLLRSPALPGFGKGGAEAL